MATLTLNPTVNGDVYAYEGSWPLTGAATKGLGSTKYAFGAGYNGAQYYLYNMLLRFDTSSLPDTAIISSAKLRLYWSSRSVAAGSHTLSGEYFDCGAAVDTTDCTITTSSTAWTGVDPANFVPGGTPGYYEFTLLNPNTSISKTGFTGFRTHSNYSGTPTTNNLAEINLVADANKPELVITYTVPTNISAMTGMSGLSGMN